VELVPLIIVAIAYVTARAIGSVSEMILQRDWLRFCRDMERRAVERRQNPTRKKSSKPHATTAPCGQRPSAPNRLSCPVNPASH
jgi:hypothetical protein